MAKQPKQEDLEIDPKDNIPGDSSELFENKEGSEPEEVVTAKADATDALQKQIEDLKKSEQIQRDRAEQMAREREEARREAERRATELDKFQKEASQSKLDAIGNAIAAAQAEADAAQRDITAAAEIGDFKAQSEAYRKLAKAEANLARLEDGKVALEEAAKAEPVKEKPAVSEDPIERTNLPDTAKTWLRAHPDYLTDPRKNAKIQSLHWDIVDEGHAPFSDAYFESMEQHLGLRAKPDVEVEPQERKPVVSAPVSRQVPNSQGQRRTGEIRLTPAQREIAKMAGITEAEYAKQLQRLDEAKANGQIQ